MSHNSILFLSKFIEAETGILFQEINLYQLQTRLEEIVKSENLKSIDELAQQFQKPFIDPMLKQKLLDHATNNETLFFRDPTSFTALKQFIIQEVLPTKPSEIKIWSAASSTGQEALSVAILLNELSTHVELPPFSITATDLSQKVIARAKTGVYADFEIMRGLSEDRRQRYFTRCTDGWLANASILSKVRYGSNNLVSSNVKENFHLILCRNVLIYQKVEVKKVVVENLFKQLLPGGGVLLGVGETMLGIKENVEYSMIGDVLIYKKSKKDSLSVA